MFAASGEQEPRIRSDDAPTVKKRRSRRKLALSSVSKAFLRSTSSASPSTKQTPVVDIPSPRFDSPRSADWPSTGDRDAWRSTSNPALARAHTFETGLIGATSSATGDGSIEQAHTGIRRPSGYLLADDGPEGSGPHPRKGKGRVVSASAHHEMLRKQPLRASSSIPNFASSQTRFSAGQARRRPPIPERFHEEDVRTSFRSALTLGSSVDVTSGTERSSIITKSSSVSDFFVDAASKPPVGEEEEEGMSVEDAVSMYIDGFDDGGEIQPTQSFVLGSDDEQRRSMRLAEAMNDSIGDPDQTVLFEATPSTDLRFLDGATHSTVDQAKDSFNRMPPMVTSGSALRDRYGFKKSTQYISVSQYDEWNANYSKHLSNRKPKWEQFLKEHGLSPTDPIRFPPKGPKGKRYVRKGIPPEYRGAAWFWYSGAYTQYVRNPGLYQNLVREAEEGRLSTVDQEHIERDLNRTYPENIHFKPETSRMSATVDRTGLGDSTQPAPPDTLIIQSLRRVLYSFALHNPKIGYCQSLNFLAGLFLLFLPEERAFWTLQVLTTTFLPGTHEISLEGANVDLWVLMTLLKESMPTIYAKTLTAGPEGTLTNPTRLPPITLCLTSWLMSLFIGSLPIETTMRVWDIFFYEGSRTFFRIALAIFKAGERQILAVGDPMETFQVVQTIPRRLLDVDNLIEGCYRRRGGFGHVSQEMVEELRAKRREIYRMERVRMSVENGRGEEEGLKRQPTLKGMGRGK